MKYVFSVIVITVIYSSIVNAMIVPFNKKATIELYNNYPKLDIDAIRKYIQEGADVNYTPDKYSPTLLMFSMQKPLEHMQIFLENNADVNARVNSRTALHWAIEKNDPKKVKLLLGHNPKNIWTAYAIITINPLIIGPILDKEKRPLAFMRIVVASCADERPRSDSFDDVVRCFLDRNIFEEKMLDDVMRKIVNNPFNHNAIQLLKLFCEYKKFSQIAFIMVSGRLLQLKKEQLNYEQLRNNDFLFTEKVLTNYLVNIESQITLKDVCEALCNNNQPKL